MFFDDWEQHLGCSISPSLLWEYDLSSPDWDWDRMATTVVRRVIELGLKSDYYAIFQIYNGLNNVIEIVKQIPFLNPKDLNWACTIFHIKKEEMFCYKRRLSRQQRLSC